MSDTAAPRPALTRVGEVMAALGGAWLVGWLIEARGSVSPGYWIGITYSAIAVLVIGVTFMVIGGRTPTNHPTAT